MRLLPGLLLVSALCAQEDFRAELTLSAWPASVEGTLQAAGLPVDLRQDLALESRSAFFGRITVKPARRHRIIVEGAPYSFEGAQQINRTITFAGRTFTVNDRIASSAELAYLYAGYQFELISRPNGFFGFQTGGAYLDATGSVRSTITGLEGRRNQRIGLPLGGASFRFRPFRFLSIAGGVKGMTLAGYGHFVQGEASAGLVIRRLTFRAGYQILDADIHEDSDSAFRAGISPRISGPIFSLQFRL